MFEVVPFALLSENKEASLSLSPSQAVLFFRIPIYFGMLMPSIPRPQIHRCRVAVILLCPCARCVVFFRKCAPSKYHTHNAYISFLGAYSQILPFKTPSHHKLPLRRCTQKPFT